MRIVELREEIRSVRERWRRNYSTYSRGHRFPMAAGGLTVGDIAAALSRLDLETCSVADVDAAIGRSGWAELKCDECNTPQERVVRLGDEPDYDVRWQDLCGACLSRALDLLKSST